MLKQLSVRSCGHGKNTISAVKCLNSLVKNQQEKEHYLIATTDASLIQQLRQFPNCPVITLRASCLTILKPPGLASLVAEQKLEETLMEESEVKELKELKKREFGEEPDQSRKRKKKGPKQPNPLSCLKKKKNLSKPQKATEPITTMIPSKKRRQRRKSKVPLPVEKVLQSLASTSTSDQ